MFYLRPLIVLVVLYIITYAVKPVKKSGGMNE